MNVSQGTSAHNPAVVAMLAQLTDADRADAAAILAEQGLSLTDPETAPPHAPALAAFGKRYGFGCIDSFIVRRVGADCALLINLVLHFAGGDETRFGWQYMHVRFGWSRSTYTTAVKAGTDQKILIERPGDGFDRRKRLRVDIDVFQRVEREEMRAAFTYAKRQRSLSYMVRGLELIEDDDATEAPPPPVEAKGFPLAENPAMQGFPLAENPAFDCAEIPQSVEEVNGIGISKSIGIPARDRQPGDDDDLEAETPTPPAPAKPPADDEIAAETLFRGMAAMGIEAEPEALRTRCALVNVTPAEARAAITAGQNSPNEIGGVNYFFKVIENNRKEGRKRDFTTPVGGHADPAITRRVLADLDSARQRQPTPDAQAGYMSSIRTALKHRKA